MTLAVAHPRCTGALADDECWIYADENISEYAQLVDRLNEERRLMKPASFQGAISQTAEDFLDWVDSVLSTQERSEWIAASHFKDIVCTPMLLQLAILRIATEATRAGQNILVVTSSAALVEQIVAFGGSRRSPAHAWWTDHLKRSLSAWAHWLIRPWQIYLRCALARWQLGSNYRSNLKGMQILIDTFFFPDDLSANGDYRDRFSPGLIEWYGKQGWRVAAMPYTGHIAIPALTAAYRRMRNSHTLFAVGELFLGFSDCLRGAATALHSRLRPPPFAAHQFKDLDVAPMARRWWHVSALRTVTYRIWQNTPQNMARCGLRPEYLVDWYENQPLDKAVCLGFADAGGVTRVIAGRQYLPASSLVNFFSTAGEIAAGASPRLNWVCGPRIASAFARHDPIGQYETVPALRYAHLFADTPTSLEGGHLAVFLTSSPSESMAILDCVFTADAASLAVFDGVMIKMHQSVNDELRNEWARRWPALHGPRIRWETRPVQAVLNDARLVMTGGSSVALEAVCRGQPVIVCGRPAGVGCNVLENVENSLWRVAYSGKEFGKLLREWLSCLPPLESRRENGRRIRDAFFETSTATGMRAFDPRRAERGKV
jgi:hypothetical protein